MALKDKHLADGEEIRLDLRTHWKALVGPLVLLVLLVAFVAAAAVLTRDSDQRTWIVLGVAVVALALAVPGSSSLSGGGTPRVMSSPTVG